MPLKGQKMTPRPKGAKQLRVAEALEARMDYLGITEQEIKDKLEATPKAERPLHYGNWRTFRNGIDTNHTQRTVRAVEDMVIWEHGTIDALQRNRITVQQAVQQGDGTSLRDMAAETAAKRRADAIAANRPLVPVEGESGIQQGRPHPTYCNCNQCAGFKPPTPKPTPLPAPKPAPRVDGLRVASVVMDCADALAKLNQDERAAVVQALADRYCTKVRAISCG